MESVFPPYVPLQRDAIPVKRVAYDWHTLPRSPRTWVEAEAFLYESGCPWSQYIDWLPMYDAPLRETGITIEVSCRNLSDYDEKQQGYLLVLDGNTQEPCSFGRQLVLYQEFPVERRNGEAWGEAGQRTYEQYTRPAAFDYLQEAQEFLMRFLLLEKDDEFRVFRAIASGEERLLLGMQHKWPFTLAGLAHNLGWKRQEDERGQMHPDLVRIVPVLERLLSTGLVEKDEDEFHTPEFGGLRLDIHHPFVVFSRNMLRKNA